MTGIRPLGLKVKNQSVFWTLVSISLRRCQWLAVTLGTEVFLHDCRRPFRAIDILELFQKDLDLTWMSIRVPREGYFRPTFCPLGVF